MRAKKYEVATADTDVLVELMLDAGANTISDMHSDFARGFVEALNAVLGVEEVDGFELMEGYLQQRFAR